MWSEIEVYFFLSTLVAHKINENYHFFFKIKKLVKFYPQSFSTNLNFLGIN